MSDEQLLKVLKNINITSIVTTVPNLFFWTWVFFKIMLEKEKAKYKWLIAISLLMIVSMISSIAGY